MKRVTFFIICLLPVAAAMILTGCKKDTTPPEITLIGNASVIFCNDGTSVYTDPGATASDDTDGDITTLIVVNNPVNPYVNGIYTITYNVSDKGGNAAEQAVRTVTVQYCK